MKLIKVTETQTFKKLEPIKQMAYKSASVRREVRDSFIIAKNMGYENWIESHNPIKFYRDVVKELINNEANQE